jgi:hypothetical protein
MSEPDPEREKVVVHPDGITTTYKLSPEESAKMDEEFLRKFDPETMELRSLQEFRKRQARSSAPPRAKSL